MPRAGGTRSYFNFVAGKVSDASPLVSPENTARILQNVDLFPSGKISRRLGLDYEQDYVLGDVTYSNNQLRTSGVGFYEWLTVSEDGSRNFYVVRVAEIMYIYDQSGLVTSNNLLATIDISSKSLDLTLSKKSDIQVASGKGVLFVSGDIYDPFYISYDTQLFTFTINDIAIQIRDFDGVDDGLELEDRPTELSDLHHYNLRNQGWRDSRADSVGYPSNADIEYLGMKVDDDGDLVFSVNELTEQNFGNGRAPNGHYVVNAFIKNRQEVSGIFGLPLDTILDRPASTAFFSGRVWFGGVKGQVYFSQMLTELDKAGNCYQEQDPTAETFNELLDTDGGVINIPEIGVIYKLVAVGNALMIMANNGIWQVSGGVENFTANTTSVIKVSEVGVVNFKSVVTVGSAIFFWSEEGIFVLTPNDATGHYAEQSLSADRIELAYKNIPALARTHAQGAYDRVNKKIFWSYNDGISNGATSLDAKFNSIVMYDVTLNAFYDYRIEDLVGHSPFMAGIVKGSARNEGSSTDFVVDAGVLVTVSGVNVTTTLTFTGASEVAPKVLTFALVGVDYKITFSEFTERSFHDWFSSDGVGINYQSIVETNPESVGEPSLDKQATYLISYYDYNREGFGDVLTNPRADPKEGFRATQVLIEILRKGQPFLRSTQTGIEVLRAGTPKLRSTQTVIEILRGL